MKTSITKGLDKDQKAEVEQSFKQAYVIREKLVELLEQKQQEEFKSMKSKEVYDTPSWASKHAFSLGRCNAYDVAIELLTDKK